MFSLCAFQDKQPIDSMTFLNTSFYGASTGRMTFQSILVGWGERLLLTILTGFIISARKVKQIMYSDPILGWGGGGNGPSLSCPLVLAIYIIPRTEQSRVQNGPSLTALFRYRWLSTVKPASKNLVFKNLLG